MRLDQITWTRQNKTAERSQMLYDAEGTLHLLIRNPVDLSAMSPLEAKCAVAAKQDWTYTLLAGGADPVWSTMFPEDRMGELFTRRMTPLELKCWKMEQGR
ncbi:hypothetical protein [Methylobacterium sp.]|uniref:hypothetical protein n=1 Tax=Methylobacterium sp. TaxID=409 RepID=UPI000C4A0186|nr:hypothetical protein [Methylobacterium sp.]MBP33206.1 hypothetical protein [Methylobacterium sp.]